MTRPYTAGERAAQVACFMLWPLGVLVSGASIAAGILCVVGFVGGFILIDVFRAD